MKHAGFFSQILKIIERLQPPQRFYLLIASLFVISSSYFFINLIKHVEDQILFLIIIMATLTIWLIIITLLGKSRKNPPINKSKYLEPTIMSIQYFPYESEIKKVPYNSGRMSLFIWHRDEVTYELWPGKTSIIPIYVLIIKKEHKNDSCLDRCNLTYIYI